MGDEKKPLTEKQKQLRRMLAAGPKSVIAKISPSTLVPGNQGIPQPVSLDIMKIARDCFAESRNEGFKGVGGYEMTSTITHNNLDYIVGNEPVGEGVYGEVFKAEAVSGEVVAVKVLKPKHANNKLTKAEFLQVAAKVMTLDHPNIISVDEITTYKGRPSMVMPFVQHRLVDRISSMSLDEKLIVADQLMSALDYSHKRGVIHTDLHPGNILYGDGRVLIVDYGLPRNDEEFISALQKTASLSEYPRLTPESLTKEFTVKDHAQKIAMYIAPENFLGLGIGPWTDVYSLARFLSTNLFFDELNNNKPARIVLLTGTEPQVEARKSDYPDIASFRVELMQHLSPTSFSSGSRTQASIPVVASGSADVLVSVADKKRSLVKNIYSYDVEVLSNEVAMIAQELKEVKGDYSGLGGSDAIAAADKFGFEVYDTLHFLQYLSIIGGTDLWQSTGSVLSGLVDPSKALAPENHKMEKTADKIKLCERISSMCSNILIPKDYSSSAIADMVTHMGVITAEGSTPLIFSKPIYWYAHDLNDHINGSLAVANDLWTRWSVVDIPSYLETSSTYQIEVYLSDLKYYASILDECAGYRQFILSFRKLQEASGYSGFSDFGEGAATNFFELENLTNKKYNLMINLWPAANPDKIAVLEDLINGKRAIDGLKAELEVLKKSEGME